MERAESQSARLRRHRFVKSGETDMVVEDPGRPPRVLDEPIIVAQDYGIQMSAKELNAARLTIRTVVIVARLGSGRHAAKGPGQLATKRAVARTKANRDELTATETELGRRKDPLEQDA